jgi:hypothetical protein
MPGSAPATDQDEGSRRVVISGLNHTAFDLAVYASQWRSPAPTQDSLPGCWPGSAGRDWLPAGFQRKVSHFEMILLSRASWRKVRSGYRLSLPGRDSAGLPLTQQPLEKGESIQAEQSFSPMTARCSIGRRPPNSSGIIPLGAARSLAHSTNRLNLADACRLDRTSERLPAGGRHFRA